mmetsp:Transcript_18216/g.38956  ORF Transcript_18216/g.38956 Transcript_18216/m.38956 type:complete len:115 (-) Transcript_18216:8-352(-)
MELRVSTTPNNTIMASINEASKIQMEGSMLAEWNSEIGVSFCSNLGGFDIGRVPFWQMLFPNLQEASGFGPEHLPSHDDSSWSSFEVTPHLGLAHFHGAHKLVLPACLPQSRCL